MSDGFKLETPHAKDCILAERDDPIRFIVTDRNHPIDFRLRRNGTRGGSTMWWRFVCNDINCPARLLVRWDVLAEFVNGGAP